MGMQGEVTPLQVAEAGIGREISRDAELIHDATHPVAADVAVDVATSQPVSAPRSERGTIFSDARFLGRLSQFLLIITDIP